jgi:hypothetical protein
MKKALPLKDPEAQRLLEEVQQPTRELVDHSKWADGRWLRDLVADLVDRGIPGIPEIEPGSDEGRDLRKCRDDFLEAFAAIATNARLGRATRSAVWDAILAALLIGCTIGSRGLSARLQKDFIWARTAMMRKARDAQSAPEKERMRAAVCAAMKETAAKPTRGEAFARLIEPDVNRSLGHEGEDKVSLWTIRGAVRAILEEAPRKSGKS